MIIRKHPIGRSLEKSDRNISDPLNIRDGNKRGMVCDPDVDLGRSVVSRKEENLKIRSKPLELRLTRGELTYRAPQQNPIDPILPLVCER